jgi:hypothetical protein
MSMQRVAFFFLVCGLLLRPGAAAAEQVTCESIGQKQVSCEMNTRGEVRLVQQLSRAACTEGVTWGLSKHSVWVSQGCRAVFASDGPPNASSAPAYGNDDREQLPTRVTCESIGKARQECAMDTRGEVRVVQQLSRGACKDGETWGLSKHTVWVTGGCRAVFESGGGGHAALNRPPGPTEGQIRACKTADDRRARVVSSTALKPGAWEIILSYDDGNYVCDVEASERVTVFEKLRN